MDSCVVIWVWGKMTVFCSEKHVTALLKTLECTWAPCSGPLWTVMSPIKAKDYEECGIRETRKVTSFTRWELIDFSFRQTQYLCGSMNAWWSENLCDYWWGRRVQENLPEQADSQIWTLRDENWLHSKASEVTCREKIKPEAGVWGRDRRA